MGSAAKTELLEIIRAVHLGRKRIAQVGAARLAEYLRNEELTAREKRSSFSQIFASAR
jgi:hypothetical protein